jgi:uncharacterized protein YeeX (DUF496 family)
MLKNKQTKENKMRNNKQLNLFNNLNEVVLEKITSKEILEFLFNIKKTRK